MVKCEEKRKGVKQSFEEWKLENKRIKKKRLIPSERVVGSSVNQNC